MNSNFVDRMGIIPIIRQRIKEIYGTQKNMARHLNIGEGYLSDAVCGRCEYPRGFFAALHIRRKTVFVIDDIPVKEDVA